MAQQHTGHGNGARGAATGMFVMALAMMAMCAGVVLAISIASAVGGPVAWVLAVAAILGLGFAHMKLMNHGNH